MRTRKPHLQSRRAMSYEHIHASDTAAAGPDAHERIAPLEAAVQQRDAELRQCKTEIVCIQKELHDATAKLQEWWRRIKGLLSLRNETLLIIFSHIGVKDIASVASDCKRFKGLACLSIPRLLDVACQQHGGGVQGVFEEARHRVSARQPTWPSRGFSSWG